MVKMVAGLVAGRECECRCDAAGVEKVLTGFCWLHIVCESIYEIETNSVCISAATLIRENINLQLLPHSSLPPRHLSMSTPASPPPADKQQLPGVVEQHTNNNSSKAVLRGAAGGAAGGAAAGGIAGGLVGAALGAALGAVAFGAAVSEEEQEAGPRVEVVKAGSDAALAEAEALPGVEEVPADRSS